MKTSSLDVAIGKLDEKIASLETAKQHLLDVRDGLGAGTNVDEPKVRKTRRKRTAGLPQATPSASEANHLKTGERL